jgi:hypothetical protein
MGNRAYSASMGDACRHDGLNGEVVTEVEAINVLYGCEARRPGLGHRRRGGLQVLRHRGEREDLKAAWAGLAGIKGEGPWLLGWRNAPGAIQV